MLQPALFQSARGDTTTDLKELLSSFSISSYRSGSDPGCIIDENIVNALTEAYTNAQEGIETASATKAGELYQALLSAKQAADNAAVVEIEDGGYYYFFTAYSGYVNSDNADYAWYAPHDTHVGCTHFEEDNSQYIWQVKLIDTADGQKLYSIRNCGSGYYVNRGDNTGIEASVNWSKEQTTPQKFTQLNKAGQWNVGNTNDPNPYNPAWNGNIVLYPGGENSGSAWFVRKVPEDIVAELTQSRRKLKDYIETMPAEFSSYYEYGTDPGYLASEATLTKLFDAYENALENLDIASEDECEAMLEALKAARAEADAPESIVPIQDGGYYYIFTANPTFTANSNGNFAWYAPADDHEHVGWKAFEENNNQFVWRITKQTDTDNGETFKVYNVGAGLYLNCGDYHGGNSYIGCSTADALPQVFTAAGHAGAWTISNTRDCDSPALQYYQGGHNDGKGTGGRVILFTGGLGSPAAWYLKKVPDDVVAKIDENAYHDELVMTLTRESAYAEFTEVGDDPGYVHSQDLRDSLVNAIEKGKALTADEAGTHTSAEYKAANDAIYSALAAVKKEVNTVPDGYYRLQNRMSVFYYNDNNVWLCSGDEANTLGWRHLNEKSADFVWKVTNQPDGTFSIQNANTGKYINSVSGGKVSLSDAEETSQLLNCIYANGQFAINNAKDGDGSYSLLDHAYGTGYHGAIELVKDKLYINQSTCWYLRPISEEEVSSMLAAQKQTDLNSRLYNKVAQGRQLYYSNTNFTTAEPIIKDDSQIYSNNPSDAWGYYGNLIDGSMDTHWSSAYEVQKEDSAHYLRFYCEEGFPDSVVVRYASRQNGFVHRMMSYIRVQVSNDAESWTSLPWTLTMDDLHTPTTWSQISGKYFNFNVDGLKGYKYVRFVNLASVNEGGTPYIFNNHPVMDYSEFNLYPITGIDAESPSQAPLQKGLAQNLLEAIEAGVKEYNSGKGTATQATIDAIDMAISNYSKGNSLREALALAASNIEAYTAGDKIGEFPEEAYNSYKDRVEAMNADIDNKGENISAESIIAYAAEADSLNSAILANMNKPQPGHWYVIKMGATSEAAQNHVLSTGGKNFNLNNNGKRQSFTTEYTSGQVATNLLMSFVFKENEDGSFDVQNVGTGAYFGPNQQIHPEVNWMLQLWDTSFPVRIIPMGNGKVALEDMYGYYLNASASNPKIVYFANYNGYPSDEGFAWEIAPVEEYSEELTDMSESRIPQGSYTIITKPYDLATLPVNEETNESVIGYEIIGARMQNDSAVAAYNLRAISEEEVIKAGTPVIYRIPASEKEFVSLSFIPVLNGNVKLGADTINGLCGTSDFTILSENVAIPAGDSLQTRKAGESVDGQRGFIVPRLVTTTETSEPDAVLYADKNGVINSIEKIVPNGARKVDVWTIDGVRLKHGVKADEALRNLTKGVYVIDGKKVLIK